jgi:hypothetical protein
MYGHCVRAIYRRYSVVVCAIDRRVDYPPRSPYEYYRFFLEDLGLVGLEKHRLVERRIDRFRYGSYKQGKRQAGHALATWGPIDPRNFPRFDMIQTSASHSYLFVLVLRCSYCPRRAEAFVAGVKSLYQSSSKECGWILTLRIDLYYGRPSCIRSQFHVRPGRRARSDSSP